MNARCLQTVKISKADLLASFKERDIVPDKMRAEMHEVQPLMHLLSKYVIKPVAFERDPYVLPRAAQFVKYGGANKYFSKHGGPAKPGAYGPQQPTSSGSFVGGGSGEEGFKRPATAQQERKDSAGANLADDFETVAEKPKKARVPYKKPFAPAAKPPDADDRKGSDVSGPARKESDAAPTSAPTPAPKEQKPLKPKEEAKQAAPTEAVVKATLEEPPTKAEAATVDSGAGKAPEEEEEKA